MPISALHRPRRTSLALVAALALGVAAGGCIEERPRRGRREAAEAAPAPAPVVDPGAVDGSFDRLVEGDRVVVPVGSDDASEGAALPLVTIVEFSDFECPFCGRLAANLAQIVLRYPEDVRLVFKQFPLPMHANAEPAARAAVAAGAQGKFWEMHDALFADRTKLAEPALMTHAKDLGLDMTRFAADFAAPATLAKVRAEANEGRVIEVASTPTFFVNGRKITGAKDIEALAQIVEEERAAAQKLLDAGAERASLYAHFMHAAKPGAGTPAAVDPNFRRGEASKAANYAIGVGPARPTRGPADARVTVVAYTDYGCAGCAAGNANLAGVMKAHPEVRFSLRFAPATDGAEPAAKAVLAAGLQGKLWEAHEALVGAGDRIDDAALARIADSPGLDGPRLDRDLATPRPAALLAEDLAVVDTVRGTAVAPLFFVNGRFLEGTATSAEIDALIAEESQKAEAFMATESVAAADSFEAMRKTWRGFAKIEEVPKTAPAPDQAGAPTGIAVRGDAKTAEVTIIACTDFDCPACAKGAKLLGEVMETYGDAVALEYRHLLPPGQDGGERAHLAALAAAKQGKFWEMHDALYRSRSARTDAALETLAAGIGLDVARWNTDRADAALRPRLVADTTDCAELGMSVLPSWKIGTAIIQGSQPKARFVAAIDAARGGRAGTK